MTDSSTNKDTPDSAASAADKPPAAVDVQAQINEALANQKSEFAMQLEQATGHKDLASLTESQLKAQGKLQELADAKGAEAAQYKQKFEQTQINNALLTASTDALDPALVSELLAGKASVDANVFPTPVGVFPYEKQELLTGICLPHARGGVSCIIFY